MTLFGGLTGIYPGQPAGGLAVSDSTSVVAHHYVGVRHRRVRDVRRLYLLVAEDDRAGCSTSASARSTSGCCLPASRSSRSGVALAWRGGMPRRYADSPRLRRVHDAQRHLDRSARSSLGVSIAAVRLEHLQELALRRGSSSADDPLGLHGNLAECYLCPPPRQQSSPSCRPSSS